MRRTRLLLAFALPTAVTASALGDPPPRAPHGMEFVLRPGIGVWSDSSTTPFSRAPASRFPSTQPGIALQIELGYRFHPRVSVGARLTLQRIGSGDVMGNNARNGALAAGLYGRYAIPLSSSLRHELWVSVGVDLYASFSRSLDPTDPTVMSMSSLLASQRLDTSAIGLPLMVGADFSLTDHIALGPVVGASLWVPYDRCATGYDVMIGARTTTCDGSGLIPNVLLFAGLNLRLHP